MSHTPGPWVVIDDRQVVTLAVCHPGRTYGYGCGNDFVCDLNDGEYHQYRNDKEQAANARLIAAAPDLLEALKGLCRQGITSTAADWDTAWSTARAAIAKAEGES